MSDLFEELGANERRLSRRERRLAEREAYRRERKKRRWRLAIISGVLVAILTAAAVIAIPRFLDRAPVVTDYPGPGEGSVTVTIPEGATGREMATILADADVVATERAFIDAYNADGRSSNIQPGTYTLRKKMSGAGAVSALLDSSNQASVRVTIPEGFTEDQVYARLADLLGLSEEEVRSAAGDSTAIGLPEEANGDPEGWFAPATYVFEPGTTATEALSQMVSTRVEQMESSGISRENWERSLIEASIIEREVSDPGYYGQVARVIENRLGDTGEVNGYLQMDSTVLYGVGKTGGIPTSEELQEDTPYNTYLHAGLPPTPIGSPGMEAVRATIEPPAGDWLYFVAVNLDTGETKFAATLEEHNSNVAELRDWMAANSSSSEASASSTSED
ncbi:MULTISPECIES: endolytic transglycosylase MltG [unclassified Actinobaculum]|uniref:endolytic transglycosylase MltG n=1 Tax=unclassified Actinobaculum TaxID=2609299 RepID=UPI000D5287D7|nr:MULTISPECIES: endolytic transglycosylase MltG [unclassified Actinobaculum]AWE42368.1 endolytic transglycosylase MltG [Actinobaculum sp. 313]RTE50948.1 endolytic transglycosylase MltG [Actinobaculum sp. 352]